MSELKYNDAILMSEWAQDEKFVEHLKTDFGSKSIEKVIDFIKDMIIKSAKEIEYGEGKR